MVYYVTRLSEKKKVHAHCQIVYRSDYTTLDMLEIQKSGIRQMSLHFFFTCPESHRRPHHSCWTSAASVPPLPYYWNYCPWRIPSFERQGSHRSQHTYPPYYITRSLFCRQPRRGALRELLSEIWEIRCFEKILFIIFLVAETGSEKLSDTCCCTSIPMKKFDEMNAPLPTAASAL